MKTFVTIFPEAENIHLIKDVGMIPYIMYKNYGYNAKIVCYKNGRYDFLNNEVKGLKVDFIDRITNKSIIDGVIYLLKKSKNIDVLNLYHLKKETYIYIWIYKLINKKGKVYLKLDADEKVVERLKDVKRNIKFHVKYKIVNRCEIISSETTKIYNELKKLNLFKNLYYIPNGCYIQKNNVNYDDKENVICTVGRLGTEAKATEILLEGFRIAFYHIKNWQLHLIGPIEENFKLYIDNYIKKYPYLKNNIKFLGQIDNRLCLYDEYKKAKIFCLPSRHESFGIVLTEAMSMGCFIIMSNINSSYDITDNNNIGKIFKIDDYNELGQLLIKYCNKDDYLREMFSKTINYYNRNFDWIKICNKINKNLNII